MHFTSTLVSAAFLTLANAASLSGQATFYGGNLAGGACSFSTYTLPSNILGTALSDSNWDTSANCGACVSVTGPAGNSILAMIVDECPGCGSNHLDLFPDAFADLANPTTGVIDVTWDYVDCPITSPLQLHNKEGVSAYWFSMQVVNANQAVSTLEVSTDGGSTWQSTTRQTYNFFEISSGVGTTNVDIKVTSVNGDVVIVDNVEISSGASTTASSNFGTSGTVVSSSSAPIASSSSIAASSLSSTPETAASTSEAPVAAAAVATTTPVATVAAPATTTAAGANFQELSSSTASYSTTPITTPLSSTSAPVAVVSTTPLYTSSSSVSTSAAGGALASSPSLSIMTISTCSPTVLYSVVTVSPTSMPTASSTSLRNGTVFSATATPTQFTGSASTVQGSIALAAVAGLIGFFFA